MVAGKHQQLSKTPRHVDKNVSIAGKKHPDICQQESINSSLEHQDKLARKQQQLTGKYLQLSKTPRHVDKNVSIAVKNTETCWKESIKRSLKHRDMLTRKYQQLLRHPDMLAGKYQELSKTPRKWQQMAGKYQQLFQPPFTTLQLPPYCTVRPQPNKAGHPPSYCSIVHYSKVQSQSPPSYYSVRTFPGPQVRGHTCCQAEARLS